MGAAREGFNLLKAAGRYHLRQRKRWRDVPWHYVWTDTVLPLYCRVVGHVEYDCSDPPYRGHEFACRRCHQFTRHIPYPRDPAAIYPPTTTT